MAAERGTIWARPECFRDDPDVAEPYVDLLERRQVLVGPGQPHWELIAPRARASLDEPGPLELPLEPTSAAAFVLDELLRLLVHALARRAAEDGRAIAAEARADGCWRVRLTGPLSPARADPLPALRAEAARLFEALRRNGHAFVFSPYRAHALVKGRLDALVIERVLELASSHGFQVEVEPLRDVGELLVLAPGCRIDQPD